MMMLQTQLNACILEIPLSNPRLKVPNQLLHQSSFNDELSVLTVNDEANAPSQGSQKDLPPQMSSQMQEQVLEEGFARCQELWQNRCHSKASLVATRCTTCYQVPSANRIMTAYMTTILTYKNACNTLSLF
jgi:hypothetical protein